VTAPRSALFLALLLCARLLAACTAEVASGLDEAQAQEALAALSERGVAATRKAEGEGKSRRYTIQVPSSDAGRAAEVLRARGLPRPVEKGFADLYGAASMIPSTTEERARFLKALSGEIASQLERFDGVADASVIVNAPQPDPLAPVDAARPRPSASVLLKVRAGAAAPAADDVKRLVAAAVEGLDPAAVAVVTETMPAPPQAREAYTSLFGIHVARGSKGALVAVLASALALVALMGVWVLFGARRRMA
jgi:type III secretion protein J